MLKKLLVLLSSLVIYFSLASCNMASAAGAGDTEKTLVVWGFNDELKSLINDYYKKDFSNIKIDYSLVMSNVIENKLDQAFSSGSGAPDVFALEESFVRKYVEQGDNYLLDLTDVYDKIKTKMIDYPAKIGTCNGKVYALSWTVSPGAFIYRRSLAKQYFGTDDPDQVQAYFENVDKFLDAANLLKTKSNNKCCVISSYEELYKPYLGLRENPWIVNGQLKVDPVMEKYMDMCKTLRDSGLEARAEQWSGDWFNGMKDALEEKKVFGYFLPEWGLQYVLKPNAIGTEGDWAVIKGPSAWHNGEIWIAAYKGTKNPKQAKEMIEYLCSNDSFLEKLVNDNKTLVVNKNVVNKMQDNTMFSDSFLGGQNYYKAYIGFANDVNGSIRQSNDVKIEEIFMNSVKSYVNGEATKETALNNFKQEVNQALGL